MKHIAPFAVLGLAVVGCAAEPVEGPEDLGPPPDVKDDEDDGEDEGSAYGCDHGVSFDGATSRIALGGTLDVEIDNERWFSKPRVVASSAPQVLQVTQTSDGAMITGVGQGSAEIVVSRCGRRIASRRVTVLPIADIEVRLSHGMAGRTEPLDELVAAVPGPGDQLEVFYLDEDGVPLPGRGAASFHFEGGVEEAPLHGLWFSNAAEPRDLVSIAVAGAGRFTAIVDELEVGVDVTTVDAPARLELELVEIGWLSSSLFALVVRGEDAGGRPVAGFAPTFTIAPEGMLGAIDSTPGRQRILIGEPSGEVTFTAEVAGVTATLTRTFP